MGKCSKIFWYTSTLNMNELKKLEQTKLVYKMKNTLLRTQATLCIVNEKHDYNVGSKNEMRKNYARTCIEQNSPMFRAVDIFQFYSCGNNMQWKYWRNVPWPQGVSWTSIISLYIAIVIVYGELMFVFFTRLIWVIFEKCLCLWEINVNVGSDTSF